MCLCVGVCWREEESSLECVDLLKFSSQVSLSIRGVESGPWLAVFINTYACTCIMYIINPRSKVARQRDSVNCNDFDSSEIVNISYHYQLVQIAEVQVRSHIPPHIATCRFLSTQFNYCSPARAKY